MQKEEERAQARADAERSLQDVQSQLGAAVQARTEAEQRETEARCAASRLRGFFAFSRACAAFLPSCER